MATTVVLRGPVSDALLDVIRARFELEHSVLTFKDLDQASVRALLTLLWDTGHEVQSIHSS